MHIHNPKLLLKPFTIIQAMHAFSEWFPSMKTSLCSFLYAAAAAKLLQSYPTLCDPLDSSPPGSPVPGIPQARTLEWVAISFSNAWKWKGKVKSLSRVRLLATPWTAAYQTPASMGDYIIRNARLDEVQAGIKIAGRNINNLRYADDTTLWQKAKRN